MKNGLNLTKSAKENKDKRNYSFSKTFGSVDPLKIPDFMVGTPLEIKDQGDTDLCTAFGITSLSELQEGVVLSPEYQFMKIKQIDGDWQKWGATIQGAFKSLLVGSLPQKNNPHKLEEKGRDFVANPANWESELFVLDRTASEHKKMSYFKIDGQHDTFDNIRSALYLNRTEKRAVGTGCMWKGQWTHSRGGIISPVPLENGVGHFFIFLGQKTIDGTVYLVAQNSVGQAGDNGLYYFDRITVNREFVYGAYTAKDMPQKKARKVSWTFIQRLRYLIKKNLITLFKE